MRKRLLLLTVVSVVIIGALLFLAACTRAVPAAQAPSGETAEEILARAASMPPFTAEVVAMTVTGQTTVAPLGDQKLWVKGKNIRIELTARGQATVAILNVDKGVMYMYFPAQNMATESKVTPQDIKDSAQYSPAEMAKEIAAMAPKVVGSETIDGKECLVIEFTPSAGTQAAKVWVWKKYGFPIRQELTMAASTQVVEYKNIEFGNIPDSMFELPKGVTIQQQ